MLSDLIAQYHLICLPLVTSWVKQHFSQACQKHNLKRCSLTFWNKLKRSVWYPWSLSFTCTAHSHTLVAFFCSLVYTVHQHREQCWCDSPCSSCFFLCTAFCIKKSINRSVFEFGSLVQIENRQKLAKFMHFYDQVWFQMGTTRYLSFMDSVVVQCVVEVKCYHSFFLGSIMRLYWVLKFQCNIHSSRWQKKVNNIIDN